MVTSLLRKRKQSWEGGKWPGEGDFSEEKEGQSLPLVWPVRGCLACGMKNRLAWIHLVGNIYRIEAEDGGHVLSVRIHLQRCIFHKLPWWFPKRSLRKPRRAEGRANERKPLEGVTISYPGFPSFFKTPASHLYLVYMFGFCVRVYFRQGSWMNIKESVNYSFLGLTWNLLK